MIVNNTSTTSVAKQKHDLSFIATKLLGRAMAAASIMVSSLKGEERVILEWIAEGPMKFVYAGASRAGEVRGCVSNPKLEMTSSTPLGYAMRTGLLKATNILYSMSKPYTSTVQMAGADLVSDMMQYYKFVEQIPTHLDLETTLNEISGEVSFSGGILIQPLPQSTMEEANMIIKDYNNHLRGLPTISSLILEKQKSLREILSIVALHPSDITDDRIEKHVIDFFCRCSKQQLIQNAVSIDDKSYDDLKKVNFEIERPSLYCFFCHTEYVFDKDDINEIENQRETKRCSK